ncbi:hypothetical protein [Acinetobacter sp. XH1639]|uniref:hypothetical protein n=1 Tax=Acinetobacter sp. XH1639 TaxID=3157368 RepID=UPI0032B3D732
MQNLVFPSGLSVQRAKKRAKELVKSEQVKTQTAALDVISFKEMNKPWALAMAQLQKKSDSLNHLITLADIERILEQEPLLDYNGFGYSDSYHESFYKRYTFQDSKAEYLQNFKKNRQSLKKALDECQRCCMYLQHLKKIKATRYNLSSYTFKHSVEYYHRQLNHFDNVYVSNGAFICAALHMGFKVIRKNDTSPNAWVCASIQSDIVMWGRLLDQQNSLEPKELKLLAKLEKKIGL